MKIIITEHQYNLLLESNAVEQILDNEDIKLSFEYVTKSRTGTGTEYHNIWAVFTYPDDTKIVGMSFRIKDNDIMVHGYGAFNKITENFKYLPKNVVTDYFIGKGIDYLVNYLKGQTL